jgi:hypothetical protein
MSKRKRTTKTPRDSVDAALRELGNNIYQRYMACNDAFATPSSLLLAVANAIEDVRAARQLERKP